MEIDLYLWDTVDVLPPANVWNKETFKENIHESSLLTSITYSFWKCFSTRLEKGDCRDQVNKFLELQEELKVYVIEVLLLFCCIILLKVSQL